MPTFVSDYRLKEHTYTTISTGYQLLDGVLGGGLTTGQLIVAQAPSGVGKTTLMLRWAIEAIRNGQKVLYISAGEQDADEIVSRFACAVNGNSYKEFIKETHEYRQKKIDGALDWLQCRDRLAVYYTDDAWKVNKGGNDFGRAMTFAKENGIKYVFYDYLGSTPAGSQDEEYAFWGEKVGKMKNYASDNEICLITAIQTNRSLLQELRGFDELKTPLINEEFTAKSVGVVQKATQALTLFRVNGLYYIDVFKNRLTGEVCRVPVDITPRTFALGPVAYKTTITPGGVGK